MSVFQQMRARRGLFPVFAAFALGLLAAPCPVLAGDDLPSEGVDETPATFGFYALEKARWEDEERVRGALRQPISVDFQETSLREALAFVAESIGAQIRYEMSAESESNLGTPISLALESDKAVRIIRSLFQATDASWSWEYYLDGRVIVVSDHHVLLATIIYDLTKLVELGFRVETGAPYEIDSYRDDHLSSERFAVAGFGLEEIASPGAPSPLRIVGLSQWEDEPSEELIRAVSLRETSSTLKQLIQFQTSGPWYELDGIGGTADMFGTRLIVRHNERCHAEIDELINRLTQAAEQPPGGPPVALFGGLDERGYAALAKRVSVSYDSIPFAEVLEDMSRRFDFPYRIDDYDEDPESLERTRNQLVSLEMVDRYVYDILSELGQITSMPPCVVRGTVWFGGSGCCDLQYAAVYDVRDFDPSAWPDLVRLFQNETSGPWLDIDGIGGGLTLLDNGFLIINQTPHIHGEIAVCLERLRAQGATKPLPNPADDEWTTRIYPIENAGAIDWLVDAVQTFVRPDSWDTGGGAAAIRGGGHTLIIRQTGAGHRDVARLLERIEWAHGYVREHLPAESGTEEPDSND